MAQDSFPDFNDILRDGVIGVVGQINPEGLPVGGVLGFVIGLVWPATDTSTKTWESIKEYAEKLVKRAIDDAHFEDLNNRIEGIKNVANAYRREPMGASNKGGHLTSLLTALDLFEPDFFSKRNPERMFPLFTSFATLRVFALAEQALYYEQVYGTPDTNAAAHLEELRSTIKKYTTAAQALFDRLCLWRFGLLKVEWYDEYRFAAPSDTAWRITDEYDGFTVDASDHYVNATVGARVAAINKDFVEGLHNTLAVARLWAYADPTTPRPLVSKVSVDGPFGGASGTAFDDKPPGGSSRITRIRVRHGGVVDLIELFYDGTSAGAHGNRTGGSESVLDLADDEWVVQASGRSGLFVDQIRFTTNKDRTIGGGGDGGTPFSSGRTRWVDARLVRVTGRSDEHRVAQLSFEWKHTGADVPRYVPSYKLDAKPLKANRLLHLKAPNGKYLSSLVEEFSGRAAANEYFPTMGATAVGLEFHVPAGQVGQTLSDRQRVWVVTSERKAKGYDYLGKFSSENVYYYAFTPADGFGSGFLSPEERAQGDKRQVWEVIKVIPSDGEVMFGEHIYLRNVRERTYLCPSDNGYLSSHRQPCAWLVEAA